MTRWMSLGLLAVALCCPGCDWWRKPVDPGFDSSRARDVLVETLETWKAGKAGTLSGRNPPIRFVDDDLIDGFSLLEYRLVDPDQTVVPYENVPVVIKIRAGRGEPIERTTVYQVTLEPEIAVLRAE